MTSRFVSFLGYFRYKKPSVSAPTVGAHYVDGAGFRFSPDNVKRETGMWALARSIDQRFGRDIREAGTERIQTRKLPKLHVQLNFEFVGDEPGLGPVQPMHVGDGHRGVRQGAALVKMAAVNARDQRRLDELPVGDDGAPVVPVVGVAVGIAGVPRGAGVADGGRNDVEDDPVAAPALRRNKRSETLFQVRGSGFWSRRPL